MQTYARTIQHTAYRAAAATGAMVAIMNILADVHDLYFTTWYFDIIMHFLGGVWFGFLALSFVIWVHQRTATNQYGHYLIVALIVLAIGLAWELLEHIAGVQAVFSSVHINDTILDLIMDTLGALFSVWAARKITAK